MHGPDIQTLVGMIKKNDVLQNKLWNELFKKLKQKFLPRIQGMCSGTRLDPEDIFQQSCIKAFGRLPSLLEAAAFNGWFWTILTNEFNSCIRTKRNKDDSLDDMKGSVSEPAYISDPSDKLLRKEIRKLLKSLPDTRKVQVFLYRYGDGTHDGGHSIEETAKEFTISNGRVTQIYYEVVKMIQAIIG